MSDRDGNGDDLCQVCEVKSWSYETDGQLVPVWENPEDYNRGEGPDYIGCTNCHTMRRVGDSNE